MAFGAFRPARHPSAQALARARRSARGSTFALLLAVSLLAPTGVAAASSGHIANTWLSGNWAGYIIDGGPYTSITGQWTVPSVSSSRTGFSAVWIGLDGATNHNLIQVGTEQDSYFGRTRYAVWWEILPANAVEITSFQIRPGDRITASIRRLATNRWRISISAAGRGSFATTRTYSGRGASAEWIVEAPVVDNWQSQLARHAPVVFDHVTANGRNPKLTAQDSGALVQSRQRVAVPSVPDAQGDGFTVTRQ